MKISAPLESEGNLLILILRIYYKQRNVCLASPPLKSESEENSTLWSSQVERPGQSEARWS